MSKLFKVKEWLTVVDAARHLSIVFGENVTEADVLRLALDGRLRLSVYFVNHTMAKRGRVVQYTDAELIAAITSGILPQDLKWHEWPPGAMAALRPDLPPDEAEKEKFLLLSLRISADRYLTLSEEVTTLKGVWDLPMIGNEQLDIEHQYQNLTGGPEVTLQGLDGAFVEGRDGQMCQLQESYDNNEFHDGSKAQLITIKANLASDQVDSSMAERVIAHHKKMRAEYLKRKASRPQHEDYYPAGGLPKDAVLVVRAQALREFEKAIDGENQEAKPFTTTERDSLLKMVIGMAVKGYLYNPDGTKSSTPKEIVNDLTDLGIELSDDTVRKYLKQAANAFLPTK